MSDASIPKPQLGPLLTRRVIVELDGAGSSTHLAMDCTDGSVTTHRSHDAVAKALKAQDAKTSNARNSSVATYVEFRCGCQEPKA